MFNIFKKEETEKENNHPSIITISTYYNILVEVIVESNVEGNVEGALKFSAAHRTKINGNW